MVGDDDLQPQLAGAGHLVDRGDATVDGKHQLDLVREARECLAVQPVPLLEARRQVPDRRRPELAQQEDRERGRADAVGVVVAVHADAGAAVDRAADRRDSLGHVPEPKRIVTGDCALEERAGQRRIGIAAPDEHGRRRSAEPELLRERARLLSVAGRKLPGGVLHWTIEGTEETGRRWR